MDFCGPPLAQTPVLSPSGANRHVETFNRPSCHAHFLGVFEVRKRSGTKRCIAFFVPRCQFLSSDAKMVKVHHRYYTGSSKATGRTLNRPSCHAPFLGVFGVRKRSGTKRCIAFFVLRCPFLSSDVKMVKVRHRYYTGSSGPLGEDPTGLRVTHPFLVFLRSGNEAEQNVILHLPRVVVSF